MNQVKLKSSFEEILGKNADFYSEDVRKDRWGKWKALALKKGDKELVEVWTNIEACHDCYHINEKEAWCNLQGLPCTVNPILSFQMGIVGMACMGAAHTKKGQQELQFENDNNDLPF